MRAPFHTHTTRLDAQPAMSEPPAKKARTETEAGEGEVVDKSLPEVEGDPLEQLLSSLDTLVPSIPDAATQYYLNRSGFHSTDKRL